MEMRQAREIERDTEVQFPGLGRARVWDVARDRSELRFTLVVAGKYHYRRVHPVVPVVTY